MLWPNRRLYCPTIVLRERRGLDTRQHPSLRSGPYRRVVAAGLPVDWRVFFLHPFVGWCSAPGANRLATGDFRARAATVVANRFPRLGTLSAISISPPRNALHFWGPLLSLRHRRIVFPMCVGSSRTDVFFPDVSSCFSFFRFCCDLVSDVVEFWFDGVCCWRGLCLL